MLDCRPNIVLEQTGVNPLSSRIHYTDLSFD